MIAKKTIYVYKWRGTEVNHRHVRIECRKIVQTRLDLAAFEMQKVIKQIRKKFIVLNKVVSALKLRVAKVTFERQIGNLSNKTRGRKKP